MHVTRLPFLVRPAPTAREVSPKAAPLPAGPASSRVDEADRLGPWLASKVVEALEYRAAQKLGAVPPRRASGPTVAEVVGHWAVATGRKTAQLALRVAPPEEGFVP